MAQQKVSVEGREIGAAPAGYEKTAPQAVILRAAPDHHAVVMPASGGNGFQSSSEWVSPSGTGSPGRQVSN